MTTSSTRTDDGRGVRERKRVLVLEDPHGRRVEHRREEAHLDQRVLGVLARRAAAREERLQGLRGEVDDPIAVDPADPTPLHRVVERMEHAQPHVDRFSGLRVDDDVGDCRDGLADALLDRARAPVGVRERLVPGEPESEERDEPSSVRTKRSSRGGAPVSSRTSDSIAPASTSTSSPAAGSDRGSRCVCTDPTSGTSARIASSTCSAIA